MSPPERSLSPLDFRVLHLLTDEQINGRNVNVRSILYSLARKTSRDIIFRRFEWRWGIPLYAYSFRPEWMEEWTQRLSCTLLATSPNR